MSLPRTLLHQSARRISSSILSTANLSTRTTTPRPLHAALLRNLTRPAQQPLPQTRHHSTSPLQTKSYDFQEIKSLSTSPTPSRVLVDVREPAEYKAGHIPTSINIPISSQPDALFLPADEFEDRFGFAKPSAEQEVVFYCKAGVRSAAAVKLAGQVGYQKVGEYKGSWLDWERKGGGGGSS